MRKELPRTQHQSMKASQRASARLQTCRERGACRRRRCRSLFARKQRERLETDYFLTTLDCLGVETQESHELRRCSASHRFTSSSPSSSPSLTCVQIPAVEFSSFDITSRGRRTKVRLEVRLQPCVRTADVHPKQPDWPLPW